MKLTIKIIIFLLSICITACKQNDYGIHSRVVLNSIDSILQANTKIGHFGKSEIFWEDEYEYGGRRKQWIYTDSIEKYCREADFIELYKHHESPIIRMVAFHLLLKHSPKEAVCFAIEDMDDRDSLLLGRCDQALIELASSIRTRMILQWPKKYNISLKDSLAIDSAIINSKQ